MRLHSFVLAPLGVALFLTPSLFAQQGSSFAERVDVNVVNVDVLISDRQGKAVTGLAKSAFQLREDDKKIKIDRFSEDGTAAALFPSIVVYVDDTHVFEAGRNAALDALSPYILERMSTAETAVMVVRFDGFVEVLESFTTDRDTVRAALEDLELRETKPSQSMLLEREAARVKGKGLTVRYRQSYVMKSASARLTDRAIAAATVGWVENPHGIETEIDEQSQAEDGNWNVTVLLTIPIAEIGLVEANGLHQANCRVSLLVVTGNGDLTRPQYMEIPLQITEAQLEEARRQVFGARANLRLPPGSHQLVVGLWDEIGGKGSYIASPIVVGQG